MITTLRATAAGLITVAALVYLARRSERRANMQVQPRLQVAYELDYRYPCLGVEWIFEQLEAVHDNRRVADAICYATVTNRPADAERLRQAYGGSTCRH